MCGICGFAGLKDEDLLRSMTDVLAHRGPDESGYYLKEGIGLGHRRLAIIDLNTGRQPLFNEDKSICITYNGEIYNYLYLRRELQEKGHRFITNTDTEVIVHLYEEMGIDCVKRLNGMFAFAIWDDKKKRLFLSRDRLGIKPLYYAIFNNNIFFASEIKSILQNKLVLRQINPQALDKYLLLRYIPGDETLLKGIYRLPAATNCVYENGNARFYAYWQLPVGIEHRNVDENICIEEFKSLLTDSVKTHLMSDVSFGAFISGGVDSGAVLGLMHKFISGKIKTFSIGFNSDIDELRAAKKISKYFNTAHREIITPGDSYQLLSKIAGYMDEPVGDAIIIPMYLLSYEAAKSVKMVLTGEGADEIFGGYIHHRAFHFTEIYRRSLPRNIRELFNKCIAGLPVNLLAKFFPYPAFLGNEGKKRLINFMSSFDDRARAYLSFASVFDYEAKNGLYADNLKGSLLKEHKNTVVDEFNAILSNNKNGLLNNVINLDLKYWLPDYTLLKLDRLTMANSLEGRVPFLDHRLVEFLAKIPLSLKLKGITTKYLLRKSVENLLPRETVSAPKRPFYFPTEKCFDANFGTYLHDLLNEDVIRRRGLFNYNYIEKLIKDSHSPELARNKQIMSLAILENWMRLFIDGN